MLSNKYIQRWVAETDAKTCFVCYQPTTSVLVNEVPGADFFYACDSHLKDRGFASISKESELAIQQREEKQKEIELLKQKWEALQERKEQKGKTDVKGVSSSNSKQPFSDPQSKSKDENSPGPPPADLKAVKPIYELHRGIYNLRIGHKKRIIQEKRTKALLESPGAFPSVPKHKPV